jgi:predicted permease
VRLALGATRLQVFRLLAAEAALLSFAASMLGVALAAAVMRAAGVVTGNFLAPRLVSFRTSMAYTTPTIALSPTAEVVLFALGGGLFSVLVVGIPFAWRASRLPPHRALAASDASGTLTPRHRRTRLALVAIQVTAAVILLMTTGLFLGKVIDTFDRTVYFDTSRVAGARVDLSLHDYTDVRGRAFFARVLDDLQRTPGVTHAAVSDGLPGDAYMTSDKFVLVPEDPATGTGTGNQRARITGAAAGISDDFFDTMGMDVVRGRRFNAADRFGAPEVTILGTGAAARLWPGEEAIGKRVMFGADRVWRTVVGIASDPIRSRQDTARGCESCVAFVPYDQRYHAGMLILVRGSDPALLVEPLRRAIRAADSDVAIFDAAPLDDSRLAWIRPQRNGALLIASLGVIALAIAALGVYGVMAHLVAARTREFGIRLALGATPRRLVASVVDETVHLVLVGLLFGVFVAAVGSRLLQWQYFKDIVPNDIPTWFAVPIVILVVGIAAGIVPARRAARVDPNVALREL